MLSILYVYTGVYLYFEVNMIILTLTLIFGFMFGSYLYSLKISKVQKIGIVIFTSILLFIILSILHGNLK